MKRRTSNMIASVLSVSVLGMQALPIFAETAGQETAIEVNTVQDFLNEYLSTKSEGIDENGNVVVNYTPITYVDETNYWMVLSAKNFYDLLSANVIFVVDGQYYVPKSQEQMDKDMALKQEIDEYFAPNNYFAAFVNDAMIKDQEIKAAQEAARLQEMQNQVVEQPVEEVKTETEVKFEVDSIVDSSKVDEKAIETADEEVEVVKIGEGATLALDAKQSTSLMELAKPMEELVVSEKVVVEQQTIEVKAAPAVVEQEEVVPQLVAVEKVEYTLEDAKQPLTTVAKDQSSTTAQDFVNAYFTSSSGNVYAQANEVNYQTILDSLSAWNKLSSADKDQVNSILTAKVGKNYQTLLQEAQTIKAGGVPVTNTRGVHTGVGNNASIYAALCGISAAVFGFIAKRKEIA